MSQSRHFRAKATYRGRVQGVGFRATTTDIARRHEVTGYVKNLSSGDVELVAEGPEAEVDGLLNDVSAAMERYIEDAHIERGGAHGEFEDFRIRY